MTKKMTEYKKYFLHAMIGSLIAGALVASVSVLIGSFTETSAKIVGTLSLIVVHALVSFFIIVDEKSDNMLNRFRIFSDMLFALLVASFITSILATWGLFSEILTSQLYGVYIITGITTLVLNAYVLLQHKTKELNVSTNIGSFLAITFAALLVVLEFGIDSWLKPNLEIYGRILGAVGILSGATIIVTAVLYKLYMQKNSSEKNIFNLGGKTSLLRIVLSIIAGLILLNIVASLVFFVLFSVEGQPY